MKYIIDTTKATTVMLRPGSKLRKQIIQQRPTSWKVFLSGVFRMNKALAFVDLPEKHIRAFIFDRVAVYYKQSRLLVNGDKYDVERWNFWTLCIFCTEGLKTGTFWRFWQWRI